jgi:multicomponent Na+:H+ antiporter subunit E
MTGFFWNILLALAWAAVTGDFTLENMIIGFVLGFLILYFTRRIIGSPAYVQKVRQVIDLAVFFVWELFLANLRIAWDVLTPRHLSSPGVIAVPLDARTDAEITLLANLITLTPGTVSLDVSSDRSVLYVHAMYLDADDIDGERRRIKQGFERRVIELLR